MGGSAHYRVPGAADGGLAAAVALARRIVTRCGRPPVELRLSWTTGRLDAVAALADRFAGARVDAEYRASDPGPLLAALEREGAFIVDATPGRPVLAQFDGRLEAALRLASVAKPTLEIQVGWDDEPADESLLDTLVSIVDAEELIAEWDCWFEGASEFGPRALGHRSILCDPRPTDMAALLNERVKFREPFRPYAASVLSEHAAEYFDLPQEDPFMVTVVDVLPTKREAIPSVCHVDGTCRIQTVPPGPESRYRQLIEHFYELEGIPLVLNTSFNVRGEPIVESPHDALRCFLNCNLDVLYLGAYRVTKVGATGQPPFEQLVPCLNESVSIASRAECREGAMREVRHHCQTRTGHRISLTNKQHDCLLLIDGRRTVAELADAGGREEDLTSTLVMLGASGFLSFRAPSPVGER